MPQEKKLWGIKKYKTFFLAFPPELDGLSLGFEEDCFVSFLGGCCIK